MAQRTSAGKNRAARFPDAASRKAALEKNGPDEGAIFLITSSCPYDGDGDARACDDAHGDASSSFLSRLRSTALRMQQRPAQPERMQSSSWNCSPPLECLM
jgi:hypothetical protein